MESKTPPTVNKKPRKKIMLLAVAVILIVFGLISVSYGSYILIRNQKTDKDGYALSNTYVINSTANVFALWMSEYGGTHNFAQMEYIVRSTNSSKDLFVGYARAADSGTYLGQGIMYETADPDWHWEAESYYASIDIPSTVITNTGAPPRPPQDETFWLTSAHSSGTAKINYLPTSGLYTLVIMNSDGSRGIQGELQIGFRNPLYAWLPDLLLPLGLIFLVCSAYIIMRRKRA